MDEKKPETVDAYIAQFPPERQEILKKFRETIRAAVPEAKEKISWGMATYVLNGNLVHFASQKNHIGFYPGVDGVEQFLDRLEGFKTSKGGIQFPVSKPIPYELIAEITRFRAEVQKKG